MTTGHNRRRSRVVGLIVAALGIGALVAIGPGAAAAATTGTSTQLTQLVTVPDLYDYSPLEAQLALDALGLTVGHTMLVPDVSCEHIGWVIGQSPAPYSLVEEGTAIDLFIAKKPPFPCRHLQGDDG
jgi:hypothetical protein